MVKMMNFMIRIFYQNKQRGQKISCLCSQPDLFKTSSWGTRESIHAHSMYHKLHSFLHSMDTERLLCVKNYNFTPCKGCFKEAALPKLLTSPASTGCVPFSLCPMESPRVQSGDTCPSAKAMSHFVAGPDAALLPKSHKILLKRKQSLHLEVIAHLLVIALLIPEGSGRDPWGHLEDKYHLSVPRG